MGPANTLAAPSPAAAAATIRAPTTPITDSKRHTAATTPAVTMAGWSQLSYPGVRPSRTAAHTADPITAAGNTQHHHRLDRPSRHNAERARAAEGGHPGRQDHGVVRVEDPLGVGEHRGEHQGPAAPQHVPGAPEAVTGLLPGEPQPADQAHQRQGQQPGDLSA